MVGPNRRINVKPKCCRESIKMIEAYQCQYIIKQVESKKDKEN